MGDRPISPHIWRGAPAGIGSLEVCARCGCRNDASAPKLCVPVPKHEPGVKSEYDPLNGEAA